MAALCLMLVSFELLLIEHLRLSARVQNIVDDSTALAKAFTDNPVVVQALYREEPAVDVPIRGDDPSFGNPGAPRTLLIFADYRCHFCRDLEAVLQRDILPRAADRLQIVFKNRPLFGSPGDPNNGTAPSLSWLSACMSEAAWRMGDARAFWRLHAALMRDESHLDSNSIRALAQEAGLDQQALLAAVEDQGIQARVAENVQMAESFGFTWTPVVLLDGRQVTYWNNSGFWARELGDSRMSAATRRTSPD